MTKTNKRLVLFLSVILSLFFCGFSFIHIDSKKVYASETELVEAVETRAIDYEYYPEQDDSYFCLADKYMFMIENQDSMGLCWDYSSATVLENYLAITTGEHYDFSEAWISLCYKMSSSDYTIGDGANIIFFINTIQTYGVLFEDECPNEILYNVDESNYKEVYQFYKSNAHKDIFSNISYFEIAGYRDSASTRISNVKKYLTNYGALSISYDDENRVVRNGLNVVCSNTYNPSTRGSHSVTLIGWDDNLTFTDKAGLEHTGAYICLNSWGTNNSAEVVYIAYDDLWSVATIYGVSFDNQNNLTITDTNSQVKNYAVNKYNPNVSECSTGDCEVKNVWYYGDDVELTYSAVGSAKILDATIKKNDIEIESQIDVFNVSTNSIHLEDDNLDSGCYYIYVDVDIDGDNVLDKTVIKGFTILSGAETSIATGYSNSTSVYQNINEILSSKNENILYGYTNDASISFNLEFSNYATVVDVEIDDGMTSRSFITSATNSSYTKGYVRLTVNLGTQKGRIEKTIKCVLLNGKKVTYKLVCYSMTSDDKRAYVFYDYADGDNVVTKSSDMYDYIAVGDNFDSKLSTPTNSAFDRQLVYWCSDSSRTNKISILNASIKQLTGGNYANDNYESSVIKFSLFAYAKWKDALFEVELDDETKEIEYGESINFCFEPAYDGSGNYTYTIISSQLTGVLSFDISNFSITSATSVNAGSYTIKIQVVDNYNNKTAIATKKLVISPRSITYKIDNKQSEFGSPLEVLTGNVILGNIVNGDDLQITLLCDASETSDVGTYEITGVSNNNNYNVTFENGEYLIVGANISCNVQSYTNGFDNAPHTISISDLNCGEYEITYKLEGGEYSTTPITFTNVTNGPKTIDFKITARGYNTLESEAYVEITKKQITLTWANLNVSYNGQTQVPSVSTLDSTYGIDLQFNLGDGYINANTYPVQATINNDNFEIANPTAEFTIEKARPVISENDIPITSEQIKNATTLKDIELPEGYEWKNPNQKIVDGENVCPIVYTPSDLLNFSIVEGEVTITRQKPMPDYTMAFVIIIISTLVLSVIVSSLFKLQRYAYEKNVLDKPANTKVQKPKGEEVVITFVTNSPIQIEPVQTYKRLTIKLPEPQRGSYKFCGWYTDKLFLHPYVSNGVQNNLTLYAKWEPKIK